MNSKETAGMKPEGADEDAGSGTSEKLPFEIPACCRQMMTQMTGGSLCQLEKGQQDPSAQNGGDSPGIFGRLMLRMMKACCGALTPPKGARSAH